MKWELREVEDRMGKPNLLLPRISEGERKHIEKERFLRGEG